MIEASLACSRSKPSDAACERQDWSCQAARERPASSARGDEGIAGTGSKLPGALHGASFSFLLAITADVVCADRVDSTHATSSPTFARRPTTLAPSSPFRLLTAAVSSWPGAVLTSVSAPTLTPNPAPPLAPCTKTLPPLPSPSPSALQSSLALSRPPRTPQQPRTSKLASPSTSPPRSRATSSTSSIRPRTPTSRPISFATSSTPPPPTAPMSATTPSQLARTRLASGTLSGFRKWSLMARKRLGSLRVRFRTLNGAGTTDSSTSRVQNGATFSGRWRTAITGSCAGRAG